MRVTLKGTVGSLSADAETHEVGGGRPHRLSGVRGPIAIGIVILTCGVAFDGTASAGYITTTLDSAGPGNWAVLGLGGTTVTVTDISITGPGTTTGNVGVASDGKLSLSSSTPPGI